MQHRILTALPVYNEAHHLRDVLPRVMRHADDVLVVNDGSSDETPQRLREFDGIQVVHHPHNKGYGAALKTAFDYTIEHGYDGLVTIDCDGQHQPRLIPELAAELFPATGEEIDVVSGSRYLKQFAGDSIPPETRRAINMQITKQLNETLGLKLTDSFCGFKAYRTEALRQFEVTDYGYAMPLQLWLQIAAFQMNVVEFPVPLIYLEEKRSFGGALDDAEQRMAHYQAVIAREKARLETICVDSSSCGL